MTSALPDQVFFQTDDAWDLLPPDRTRSLRRLDVREEARGLRFITSPRRLEDFTARHAADFRPYTLFGSGDFHHLTAVWTRQFTEPFHIVSFDNHPDWDIRPPRWSCGAWVNRALENQLVQGVAVWGCGNFECEFPHRLLGNRRAARRGRLEVFPWAKPGKSYSSWLQPITAQNWRGLFLDWLRSIAGSHVYITLDLDSLDPSLLFTNWEAGKWTYNDIEWAVRQIRAQTTVMGADLCGAWSKPAYATGFQKLAGWFDHPKLAVPAANEAAPKLTTTFDRLWPALTGAAIPL